MSLSTTLNLWPTQSYVTVNFRPPTFDVTKTGETQSGLILINPVLNPLNKSDLNAAVSAVGSVQASACGIFTEDGQLVWQGPYDFAEDSTYPSFFSTNLMVQEYMGKPVLTYWQGVRKSHGVAYGNITILDDTYTPIATICPKLNIITPQSANLTDLACFVDSHELFITPSSTLIVSAGNITTMDLSPIGGPSVGYVYDSQFHEIDIATGDIIFSWSSVASGIPITYSKFIPGVNSGTGLNSSDPFDWFHINAVSSVGDGYLVNSRHCWATWYLNSAGEIEWRIEGNNTVGQSDFVVPKEANFKWQHHARVSNYTDTSAVLHYFNNRFNEFADKNLASQSNGLQLSLNLVDKTLVVEKILNDSAYHGFSDSQGSFSPLDNGNTFVGWGAITRLTEFGPGGSDDVRLRIQFGYDDTANSYRAYKQSWNATPAWNPDVVGVNGTAYMSWNGATDYTAWVIYTGTNKSDLVEVATVQRGNLFETSYPISGEARYLKVAAFAGSNFMRNSSLVTVEPSY
ncbi:hypothetical protein BHYA_0050g00080 [Botrytis hyacinthi]|uniref:Arylsulfotransferase N-terminal domain-containing protein n=1 Tax=Botrytis hyacinthi TaxID=278943 RepID=A0A4Z1H2T6_9HELO|nr:hypothetical protein BHYA_0050g00080 [Botrytis hyacinthi]